MTPKRTAAWYGLGVLFAVNVLNFFDRLVIGAVAEPIRREFLLDDASLGVLSTAFTLVYAVVGLPFGRLADRLSRRSILSIGVIAWSLLTAGCGLAQSFWQMFAARLGVGIAESSCAPAATSLIGDLFPSEKRARAMSIFMLGLPIGIALSFAVGGSVAKHFGWRAAFLVPLVPGILVGLAALLIKEPLRGAVGAEKDARAGKDAFFSVLRSPTMRWLMLSGAIHNFSLYAFSFFLTPFLIRYHGLDIGQAGLVAMLINGLMSIPGLLFGGFAGDRSKSWRTDGALLVLTAAIFASAPGFYLALGASPSDLVTFIGFAGLGCALMYFYYAIVYSTIADITRPAERGTAMAVYFMVMYVLGGALGPYVVGAVSDYFTRRAAGASGVVDLSVPGVLEPFRASGLQSAMYIVPILSLALGLVLWLASRTLRAERSEVSES
jgi:predicted MFS family arabinose efflux permease